MQSTPLSVPPTIGWDQLLEMNAVLRAKNASLQAQVDGLQAEGTERAESSLHLRVTAFHLKFGHPVANTPHVPDDATVRFRLALIAEEFLELLESCLDQDPNSLGQRIGENMREFRQILAHCKVKVDLPALTDAIEDMKYVLEGTHVTCGVHSPPLSAEVHRANMEKEPVMRKAHCKGPCQCLACDRRGDHLEPDPQSKPTKPEGWRPPDITRVLLEQGWRP